MWQSLSSLVVGDGHAVQILLVVAAFVVLAAILYVLYRVLFAHRLRTPGVARGRAPRLGIVDVFELDGQRQLVIVRRDNVEHLLMIGGPNDVVVEGNIVRVAAANGVNGREGGKQPAPAAAPQSQKAEPIVEAMAAAAVPRPAAPAAAGLLKRSIIPRRADVSAPPVAESPAAAPVVALSQVDAKPQPEPAKPAPESAKAPVDTVIPLPLRPVTEPAPAAKLPPPEPQIAPRPAAEASPPRRPLPPPKPVEPAPRPNLPSPITPLRQRAAAVEPVRGVQPPAEPADKAPPVEPVTLKSPENAAPPTIVAPPAPAPAPLAVAPVPPPPEVAPTPVVAMAPAAEAPPSEKPAAPRRDEPFYDLESLEAEMARLLGRDS
jgi:hypothetical protein